MEMQNYFSLLLVCSLCVPSSLHFGGGSCIESEKQALLLFKKTLDHSNFLSSWVGDDCCAWHGIGCDNITNHVTQLELQNGGLSGKILPSLLDLKYLTHLDLSENSFLGIQIPEFFGSFENLIYLKLSYSNFEGSVPHRLGNLSNLKHLDLSNYDYSGGPQLRMDSMWWLSRLSKLEHLDLSGANLSSATDWFSSINMLPKSILDLDLSNCHLPNNIPRRLPFMNLTSLVSFDLSYNHLNSSFPSWVLNNSNLEHLSLGFNNFDGPIPDSIGSLSALSLLDLSINSFRGSIPQSITNLTSLSELDLSNNKLSDSILPDMGNLTELTYLSMRSNDLRGCLPQTLSKLSNLERLDVTGNQLTGNIPKCIGKLSNLNTLLLYDNSWEGFVSEHHFINLTKLVSFTISSDSKLNLNISSEWVPLFQLENLYMYSFKVGPKFPHWLLTQRNIQDLELSNTSISDTIPIDWFSSLFTTPRSFVDLSNNDINGEQLSLISRAPNGLGVLILSNNRLSGEFPTFLCNQTSLLTLALSNNNFSGELPRCLGNLTELSYLNLMNNDLSGKIPSLGSLGRLRYLNLAGNHLAGKIPDEIGKLKDLIFLDLSRNELYGPIPQSLSYLNFLSQLNLSFNDLSGRIPSGNQLQTLNDPSIYAGNDLCGHPILKPCAGDTDSHNVNDHNEADTDFDSDDEHMWFFAGLGPGFSVGLLGFWAAWRFSNIGIRTIILWNKLYRGCHHRIVVEVP